MTTEFVGTLARISGVEKGGRAIYLDLRDGRSATLASPIRTGLKVGDVVQFDDQGNWQRAPQGTWPAINQISVVRRVLKRDLLVETPTGFRRIRSPKKSTKLDVRQGSTVEWNEIDGVLDVVSDAPIRLRDTDIEDDLELNQFRLTKTETSPTGADFGGYETVVQRARSLIRTQLDKKAHLDLIGARPIRGVLFTGPPGTGKTLLAQILAFESGADFFVVNGPAIVSKYVGDSESLLRRIFEVASKADRAIIFFDEIDSIAGSRNQDAHEASVRLVSQFLTLMDGSSRAPGNVVVVAATNRVDDIDPALRRPGRFDWEIEFGSPSAMDRYEILRKSARQLATAPDLPFEAAVELSEGWSAAELTSVWSEAALLCAEDDRSEINAEDFAEAFEIIRHRIPARNP